ncbi:MAG: hypothetical protein NTX24_02630 [Candidatus Pacearchaeota archaeon]|nr:hypothetical protein [Candidatus Pacearchaeota archaeon]
MAERESIPKKQLETQKELLRVTKKHLKVSDEHKNISKTESKKSMGLGEQRVYWIVSIIVVILFGTIGIIKLDSLRLTSSQKDYDIKINVSPSNIELNNKQDVKFHINFTNIGKKDIEGFNVYDIYVYRIEKGVPMYKDYIPKSYGSQYYSISCDAGVGLIISQQGSLQVGKSCYLDVTLSSLSYCPSCPSYFDDKDKTVQLYFYLHSVPPIENKIFNLTIY